MSQPTAILFLDSPYELAVSQPDGPVRCIALESTDPVDVSSQIAELLGASRRGSARVILAIPSLDCFAVPESSDGLHGRGWRQAMVFRLEAHLPHAAEDLAADFIDAGNGRCLGIAAVAKPIAPWIHAIESAGLRVDAVVPEAILAVESADRTAASARAIVLSDAGRISLIELHRGRPTGWRLLAADPAEIESQLIALATDTPSSGEGGFHPRGSGSPAAPEGTSASGRASAVAIPSAPRELSTQAGSAGTGGGAGLGGSALRVAADSNAAKIIGASGRFQVIPLDGSMRDLAVRGGLNRAGRSGLVDLRQGPLAPADAYETVRKPLNLAATGLTALLLAAGLSTAIRGAWLANATTDAQKQLTSLYGETFPAASVPEPDLIFPRFQSEARLASRTAGGSPAGQQPDALKTLHDVLVRLPGDRDFSLDRLEFADTTFELTGYVDDYVDAEAVAAAIRSDSLSVQLPPAERDPRLDTWRFRISGKTQPAREATR